MNEPPPMSAPNPIELGYVSSAAGESLAPTRENILLLDRAAEYASGRKLLRDSGLWSVIWGGLCVFLVAGLLARLRMNSLPVLSLLAAGLLLVGTGVWLLINPSPSAMIVDGIMFLLLAARNLWFAFLPPAGFVRSDSSLSRTIIFAMIMLLAGINRLRKYKSFSLAAESRPSRATIDWVTQMRRRIYLTKPEQMESIIRFQSRSVRMPFECRAQLFPEIAACVTNRKLRFLTPEQLSAELVKPVGKKLRVRMNFADQQFDADISPMSFERLNRWKQSPQRASS